MRFPVLQIWYHVTQYCMFSTVLLLEILTPALIYSLWAKKTFELYFSSKVHTMLQLAVNHLQHEHSESTNSAEAKI